MSNRGTVGIKDRGRVLELPSGNDVASGEAGVAPAGRARLRLNLVTSRAEISIDENAYEPIVTGTGASPWEQNGTVVSLDDAAVTQVQVDAQLVAYDDAAALPAPTDQQFWARRVPADRAGAVVSGRLVGEGRTGEYSAPVFRALRERVVASPDIWQSGYVFEPQAELPGDVGIDVAFHAWPRVDAGAGTGGIAFQADATSGSGREWAQVVQAYEQPLKMRAISFAAGDGKFVLIQTDLGSGAGSRGGDMFLETGGGGTNGVDETGSVICQPKTSESMSPTTGPIFEARAQPDAQAGVSFARCDWLGLEAPDGWRRTGEITDQIAVSQNNYDPNGDELLHLSAIRIDNTSAGNVNLTGLAGRLLGRRFTLMNVSSDPAATVTLTHEDGASTAENRFSLAGGANLAISQFGAVELVYDITASRWRALVA